MLTWPEPVFDRLLDAWAPSVLSLLLKYGQIKDLETLQGTYVFKTKSFDATNTQVAYACDSKRK